MTLFDPGPPAEVPVDLSRGQRMTMLHRRMLAAGVHPATRRPLFVGTGEKCGTCNHHHAYQRHVRTYHKCDLHTLGESRSEASDIRIGWPACALYVQIRPADPKCPDCRGEGVIERPATPAEVDDGCELGIAFDPCPRGCRR